LEPTEAHGHCPGSFQVFHSTSSSFSVSSLLPSLSRNLFTRSLFVSRSSASTNSFVSLALYQVGTLCCRITPLLLPDVYFMSSSLVFDLHTLVILFLSHCFGYFCHLVQSVSRALLRVSIIKVKQLEGVSIVISPNFVLVFLSWASTLARFKRRRRVERVNVSSLTVF